MNIQDLKSNTTWQEARNTINNNNKKISLAIATLENATLKNKGYFTSVEKLKEAIPNPTIGSKAYVGTSEPYAIYIVENCVWVDSGYTGGDEIVANITTDRIEDGAVTSDKITTSAFDGTLSVSGKIAPADVVGRKFNDLENKVEGVKYTETIDAEMSDGYSYNTLHVFRNGATTYNPTSKKELAGVACVKQSVKRGDTCYIRGNSSGSDSVGLFVLTDLSGGVIDKLKLAQSDETITKVDVPSDGFIYVNIYKWTGSGDKGVTLERHVIEGGYKEYVDNAMSEAKAYTDTLIVPIDNRIELLRKPLSGKKIVIFGDDITEFRGYRNDWVLLGYRCSDWIAEFTGADVVNVSIGGTRYARRTTLVDSPTTESQCYAALDIVSLCEAIQSNSFSKQDLAVLKLIELSRDDNTEQVNSLKSMDWQSVDIIIFLAGTNDWFGQKNLGSDTSDDVSTTLGAINNIISIISTKAPHAELMIFTPVPRWISPFSDSDYSDIFQSTEGKTLWQYADAIAATSKKNHILCCDLYHTLGWNKYNHWTFFPKQDRTYEGFITPNPPKTDGTHPKLGMEALGRFMASFILSNIR